MIITAYKNKDLVIDVNQIANNSSNGAWILSSAPTHNNNRGSYISKERPELIVGDTYRITYTVSSYESCNVRVYLGDTVGNTVSANGTYTQVLVHTGAINRIRFWSNGKASISNYKIEHLVTIINEVPIVNDIENKSWTLSYDLNLNQWVSFHSYLPNNYLIHPNKLLLKNNATSIKVQDNLTYGKFFDGTIKPFIIESVFNEYALETKVFDNITTNLVSTINGVSTNKFFDKLYVYDEYQSSGEIVLNTTNLTKKERDWMINKFTDITNNTQNTLFSSDWTNTKNVYPIDKVPNSLKLNINKPWFQRARFRDKYFVVRFISSNETSNKMVCKFISTLYRKSQR